MLHARLHLAQLDADGVPMPLRHADLVVVARAETAALDWEVVAHTIDPHVVAPGHHDLSMSCLHGVDDDGSLRVIDLAGSAFLVRSVDNAVVFRGSGPLDGFDLELLVG
jgi:hypothetical protein